MKADNYILPQAPRWIYLLLTACIIMAGLYLSHIRFMNTEWLTRAGCLIVFTGIWSGISVVFQERLLVTKAKRRRRNAITMARARFVEEDIPPREAEKELHKINELFYNEITDVTQNLRWSLGLVEVALLLLGTFLWGFGDLLIR